MSKGMYKSVNNVARNVTKQYRDVENVARRISAGYLSVKNVARRFFEDGNPYTQIVNYTMLYDNGDECESITGGWLPHLKFNFTQKDGYATKCNTYLDFGDKSDRIYGNGGFYTKNIIDGNGYCMVGTDCEIVSYSGCSIKYWNGVVVSVNNAVPPYIWSDNVGINSIWANEHLTAGDSTRRKVSVSNVWLEPGYMCVAGHCYHWTYQTMEARCYACWICKPDDIQSLANIIGVSIDSPSALLEHSFEILNNVDAVNFMVRRCTGDFMSTAITNSTFLTALESSPYREKVYENKHWAKFLAMGK